MPGRKGTKMNIKIDQWAGKYPGASVGILVIKNVTNEKSNEKLNQKKRELEEALRGRYRGLSRNDLKSIYPIDIYSAYYKKFGNNYHVLHQLESIAGGKPIPTVSSLVEAMFMAELKNKLLTAGHDLDTVQFPLEGKISSGNEKYTGISGKDMATVKDDMLISDSRGVISSILKGPDSRTKINSNTTRVLFVIYAPPGVKEELAYQHLDDIESYTKISSAQSITDTKMVYIA